MTEERMRLLRAANEAELASAEAYRKMCEAVRYDDLMLRRRAAAQRALHAYDADQARRALAGK